MFETLALAATAATHDVEIVALAGSPKNKVESWGVPGTLDMSSCQETLALTTRWASNETCWHRHPHQQPEVTFLPHFSPELIFLER